MELTIADSIGIKIAQNYQKPLKINIGGGGMLFVPITQKKSTV